MSTTYTFRPRGVCSQLYNITISDDNKIEDIEIFGGCSGNLQGISSLIKGMPIDDVIAKLRGINCGFKGTSCPDQISQALEQYKVEHDL